MSASNSSVGTLSSGAFYHLLSGVVGRGSFILSQVLLARWLGVKDFGTYALGWAILSIVRMIAPFGFENGVVRFGAEYRASDIDRLKLIISQSVSMALVFSSGLGILIALSATWLGNTVFDDPQLIDGLQYVAVAAPFLAALRISNAALRIMRRNRAAAFIEDIFPSALLLIGVATIVVLDLTLQSAFLVTAGVYVVASFVSILVLQRVVGNFGDWWRQRLFNRPLLWYSVPTTLSGAVVFANERIDRLFLGIQLDSSAVGIYQVMSQLSILFPYVLTAFNSVMSPLISELFKQNQMEELNRLYGFSTRWGLHLCLPLYTLILLLPDELITALFGAAYADDITPLLILASAQLFNVATGAVGLILVMTGGEYVWLLVTIVSFAVNIVLNLLLVPVYEISGAALATAISTVTLFGSTLVMMHRRLGLHPYSLKDWRGTLPFLAAFALGGLTHTLTADRLFLTIMATGLVVAVVYVGVLLAVGLRADDIELLQTVRQRFRNRSAS